MRQALAGMLWTKQYYYFDADRWLDEHHAHPLHGQTRQIRNREWFHMVNDHVISMPDKWEYPWYAAWDLAFHTIALSVVDPDFAKEQLDLMLREVYLHPSGQIPAYEWNFSDVNPPVHAWATLFLYRTEQALRGKGGPRLPQALLCQAHAEFHLVGEPQGPVRQECLRRRLPRAGQHRRLRPQRAPAHGRVPGAGRRHRLDGPVLPEHDRDERRIGRSRPHLRGPLLTSSSNTSCGSPRA